MTKKPSYEKLEKRVHELERAEIERKRAEETLRDSEQFMISIFESIQDGISVLNPDLSIRHVNGVMKKWYSENLPLEGKKCFECYHNANRPCDSCPTLRCIEAGKTETDIVPGLPDSDAKWIELFSYPIKDPNSDKITGVVEFVRDITELNQAKEENLKRQQFLESVFYHAPDAVVTLDSEHRVVDWNRGAVNMFGYTPEETIGVQLDDLVARGESHVEAGGKTRQVLSGQRLEAFETVRYRKDGAPLRVIAAGSPIMIDGIITGVVAVYTDITDRVRAENALKESEQKFRTLVQQSPFGMP